MARTYHHRGQKLLHCGEDWQMRYNVDNGNGGTGKFPKDQAHTEMRNDKKTNIKRRNK